MSYNELIKNFAKIREYMKQFYVYGFKSRDEYTLKSARSYDNERRRMESWLGDYMSFRQDSSGKISFIAIDSQDVIFNPLYNAFKAKSFTPNDIMLHFFIMDILEGDTWASAQGIIQEIDLNYLPEEAGRPQLDESTVRKKLKEYVGLGLLEVKKEGRENLYHRTDSVIDKESWKDAITFFSEEDPLGVVGSYLLDKYEKEEVPQFFRFKHHYLLHAMESEILGELLAAMSDEYALNLTIYTERHKRQLEHIVVPLKIYISTQSGRRYLLACHKELGFEILYRLDSIRKAVRAEKIDNREDYLENCMAFEVHLWGVSRGSKRNAVERVEMSIHVGEGEEYILQRMEREKRCGSIEKIDENTYRYVANVYDAMELMPWIRTFTGRIKELKSDNKELESRFYEDLEEMTRMYREGGDGHGLS